MSDFRLKKISNNNSVIEPYELLTSCGKSMYEQFGFKHWYPFIDFKKFRTLVKEKELYGVFQCGMLIATFNLSHTPRDYYFEKLWSNPYEKAFYLGQLGIKPQLQGQGIGKWCMAQVERLALNSECKAIRFDCLSIHPWLKKFYEKMGYRICGGVKPSQWELTCFEKILT